jgi:amino-acid N-acetyltransferase
MAGRTRQARAPSLAVILHGMKERSVKAAVVRKATDVDIDSIHEIINAYAGDGTLLSRSLDDIASAIGNFYVAEVGGSIAGVITFHDYGDHLKEVRSLAVKKQFLRKGIGSMLLRKLIADLMAANSPTLFVLTYAPEFFKKNGFVEINMDTLPEKIWKDCMYCMNYATCSEIALLHDGSRPVQS